MNKRHIFKEPLPDKPRQSWPDFKASFLAYIKARKDTGMLEATDDL